jgi:paraquat-inducible protein B
VAVTRILSEAQITIIFHSADGLEAGKTKIQFNGAEVGSITAIRLSDDHMREDHDGADGAEDRELPRRYAILGGATTHLGRQHHRPGTPISGAYIGMDIGKSKEKRKEFTALENPPVITGDRPGRFFVLKVPDLGSLDSGTPIFYRRLRVGEGVVRARLRRAVFNVKVFVNAPYDRYVSRDTRFWQASGIDVSLTASGLSVQTQSLLSILIGGVAFETPAGSTLLPRRRILTSLFSDRTTAFKLWPCNPQDFVRSSLSRCATGARRTGGIPRHPDRRGGRHPGEDQRRDI